MNSPDPTPQIFAISGVIIFLALARSLFHFGLPAGLSKDEMDALVYRTRSYDFKAFVFAIIAGLGTGFGFWAGGRAAAEVLNRAMPAHVFVYRSLSVHMPENGMWAIPAMFIGIVGTYWGHVLTIRLLFGRAGMRAWLLVSNYKAKFNVHKILLAQTILTVGSSLILAVFILDFYTRVEEDRFVENPFFGFEEKSHLYTDVRMIATTTYRRNSKGGDYPHSEMHVYFTDGTEWSASPAEAYQPLAEFLKRKTGQPLVVARYAEDLTTKEAPTRSRGDGTHPTTKK